MWLRGLIFITFFLAAIFFCSECNQQTLLCVLDPLAVLYFESFCDHNYFGDLYFSFSLESGLILNIVAFQSTRVSPHYR